MDYDNYILISAALFAACVTLIHGYDGSTTAIRDYFKQIVSHFPLHLPSNDYRTSFTA